MQTYKIHFSPGDKGTIIGLLREYSDVIINNADEMNIWITIENDDDGLLFNNIQDRIAREIRPVHSGKNETIL